MTPGTHAAIVLRYLDRLGPASPDALCVVLEAEQALPSPVDPGRVLSSIVRLCRVGRARCVAGGLYAPRRVR